MVRFLSKETVNRNQPRRWPAAFKPVIPADLSGELSGVAEGEAGSSKSEDEIAKTRNFGKKSLLEIKEKLGEWNLALGMNDYSALKESLKLREDIEEEEHEA